MEHIDPKIVNKDCFSEFRSVNGTIRFLIDKLGLFCSEFLSVDGTIRSLIDKLRVGLFRSEFLSVNGTYCSQIAHLETFRSIFLRIPFLLPNEGALCE